MTFKLDLLVNYALIIIILSLSGSLLQVGYIIPTFIVSFVFVFIKIISLKIYNVYEVEKNILIFVFVIFFLIINFLFSISNNFGNYTTVILLYLLTILIYFLFKEKQFIYYFYNFFKLIIIFSLFGFVILQFVPITNIEIGTDKFFTGTFGYIFYSGSSVSINGFIINRNQSFFWEPGILSVYTNIFLFLSIFVFKNKQNIIIATICIITTFSTTGIFLLLLQFIYYTFTNKISFSNKIKLLLLIVPVIFLFINSFSEKKNESEKEVVSSYGMRSLDLYSGILVTLNNPIFGVGLNKEAFIVERNKYLPSEFEMVFETIENRGNSNSLLQLFYSMGIVIGFLVLFALYKQNEINCHKYFIFLIMIICIVTEPLFFSPFFMFFICSGLNKIIKIKLNLLK